MPDSLLQANAPAKLNLDLYLTGVVADGPHRGYHRIDSLVVFLDLGDSLAAAPAPALNLAVDGPFAAALEADNDNLVLRAARALAEAAGVEAGAQLTLTKTLPVAAGLGGGSADAAAALGLLARLWNVRLASDDLAALGLRLGADLPVCLYGRPAIVGGIGEVITPAPTLPPGLALVLANPGIPLSTADVFRARQGPFSRPPAQRDGIGGHNDLEPAARALMPQVAPMLDSLAGLPGARAARLTGSGPTGFALFDSRAEADAAAARLAAEHPDWWVRAASVAGDSASG